MVRIFTITTGFWAYYSITIQAPEANSKITLSKDEFRILLWIFVPLQLCRL